MEFKKIYSGAEIRSAACDIAANLERTFGDEKIVLVCVLSGGAFFFSDIARAYKREAEIDFVRVKSYNGTQAGEIELVSDVRTECAGKHVVIVDDIADSGATLNYLSERFAAAKTVSTVTMIVRANTNFEPDYHAFTIERDEFLVGYGLDYNGLYRNLDGVYALEK